MNGLRLVERIANFFCFKRFAFRTCENIAEVAFPVILRKKRTRLVIYGFYNEFLICQQILKQSGIGYISSDKAPDVFIEAVFIINGSEKCVFFKRPCRIAEGFVINNRLGVAVYDAAYSFSDFSENYNFRSICYMRG